MANRPTDFMSRRSSGMWSPMVAKHDQTLTRSGSRPARSAASFTVATHRRVVSSVKKVCRITWSKQRPPRAREWGPKATRPRGSSSSIGAR